MNLLPKPLGLKVFVRNIENNRQKEPKGSLGCFKELIGFATFLKPLGFPETTSFIFYIRSDDVHTVRFSILG